MQASFQIIQVPKPCSWTEKYSNKKDGNRSSSQNSFGTTYGNVFATNNVENYDLKASTPLNGLIFLMLSSCHSHGICMRSYFIYMYSLQFVCEPYVLVSHLYVTRMYFYVMVRHSHSFLCHPYVTRMSSVCHPYVLVCHSYVIRMSLVCHPYVTRVYSYVFICRPYVTCVYSCVIRMLLVCGFTMNVLKRWKKN